MIKVAIYVRVSTQEQADEGYSIQAQRDRLISYCKAKDFIIHDIYVDGGFSGASLDRPGIQQVIEGAKAKLFDCVLVYKLDRLSRSQRDTLFLIEEVFIKHNVDFISLNESFDTSTAFGRAMIGILSVFAQLEREQIKERTSTGRLERAKEGLFHGGGYTPAGYDYIDGKLVINKYEALQIREVYKLYIEKDYGIARIMDYMAEKGYTHKNGDWSHQKNITRVLDNKIYLGIITFKNNEYQGQHDPIFTYEQYEKIQNKRKLMRGKFTQTRDTEVLLQGFIYCKYCGGRFHFRKAGTYKFYTCYSRTRSNRHMVKSDTCISKSWNLDKLNAMVEDEIKALCFDMSKIESICKSKKPIKKKNDNADLKKKMVDIDKQINKLMDLYQYDNIPADELGRRIEKLYTEKKTIESELEIKPVDDPETDVSNVLDIISNVNILWNYATITEKRNLMLGLINRIVISNEGIEIEWSFVK